MDSSRTPDSPVNSASPLFPFDTRSNTSEAYAAYGHSVFPGMTLVFIKQAVITRRISEGSSNVGYAHWHPHVTGVSGSAGMLETHNLGIPPILTVSPTYGDLSPGSMYYPPAISTSSVDSTEDQGHRTARSHSATGTRSARRAARRSAIATRRYLGEQETALSDDEGEDDVGREGGPANVK
jgi:hypothetical protein